MEHITRKRGGVWHCMVPLFIYLFLQNAVSLLVMLAYYAQQGFFQTENADLNELMTSTTTLTNTDVMNFVSLVAGYVVLIPVFACMYRADILRKKEIESAAAETKTLETEAAGTEVTETKAAETKTIERKTAQTVRSTVPIKWYLIIIVAGAAACLGGTNMISMSGLMEASENYSEAVDILYSTNLIPELIGLGILAPITEELLFRGLVYKRFKENNSVIWSLLWSSLIFALLHANLVQGIYAFVIGVLLCYIYERYGTLKAPVLMHMATNITAVLASETSLFDFMYHSEIVFYVSTFFCCILVAAAVYLIEYFVRPYTETE